MRTGVWKNALGPGGCKRYIYAERGLAMAYKSRLEGPEADLLCDAVLALRSREECYRFFDDLLTASEFMAMSQRIAVAQLLFNNEKYTPIAEETGASTATISRVKRCVNFGADGYLLVLRRLAANNGIENGIKKEIENEIENQEFLTGKKNMGENNG